MAVPKSAAASPWLIGCILALGLLACGKDAPRRAGGDTPLSSSDRVSNEGSRPPDVGLADDGEWRIPARNFASTRYSGLDQINAGNVARLQPAFSFSTGVLRGHEAVPIVAGNTMHVVTLHPNILYALDLSRDGALKWKYDPGTSRAARGVANRTTSFAGWKIHQRSSPVLPCPISG